MEVLCNETVIPTVETDSGDGSEMESVMEGEENKSRANIGARLTPDFRDNEESNNVMRCCCWFQLVEYIGSMGKETFDLFY